MGSGPPGGGPMFLVLAEPDQTPWVHVQPTTLARNLSWLQDGTPVSLLWGRMLFFEDGDV